MRTLLGCISLCGLMLGCSRDEQPTPIPPGAAPTEIALAGAPVMIGAGDIAVCGTAGDESTGRIVDSVLAAESVAKTRKPGVHARRQRVSVGLERSGQ